MRLSFVALRQLKGPLIANLQDSISISKDDVMKLGQYKENPLSHPDTVIERRAELEHYMRSNHEVTLVILRALSEQLGLGPDVLPNIHKLEEPSVDQGKPCVQIDQSGTNANAVVPARVTFAPPVSEDTITLGEHTGMLHRHCMSRHPLSYSRFRLRDHPLQPIRRTADHQSRFLRMEIR